jgi:hypothetical protein
MYVHNPDNFGPLGGRPFDFSGLFGMMFVRNPDNFSHLAEVCEFFFASGQFLFGLHIPLRGVFGGSWCRVIFLFKVGLDPVKCMVISPKLDSTPLTDASKAKTLYKGTISMLLPVINRQSNDSKIGFSSVYPFNRCVPCIKSKDFIERDNFVQCSCELYVFGAATGGKYLTFDKRF